MRHLLAETKLYTLLKQRNLTVVLSVALLVICTLQAMTIVGLLNREKVIVTPAVVKRSFWISNHQVSDSYLEQMSRFFISLYLNVSPANAADQRTALLQYTAPEIYGALKNQLVSLDDAVKKKNIATVFYPVEITVDSKNMTAHVIGDLHTTVGKDRLPINRKSYTIQYRYDNGQLLMQSIIDNSKKEENKNENS